MSARCVCAVARAARAATALARVWRPSLPHGPPMKLEKPSQNHSMSTGVLAGSVTSPTTMFEVPCTLMQKALLELELVDVHTADWLPLNQLQRGGGRGCAGRGCEGGGGLTLLGSIAHLSTHLYQPDPYCCTCAFSMTMAQPVGGTDQ